MKKTTEKPAGKKTYWKRKEQTEKRPKKSPIEKTELFFLFNKKHN